MSLSKRLKRLRYLPKFLSDKAAFIKAGGVITHNYPIYEDFKEQAGTATGHYFHQDLLVATFINRAKPVRHIDVGSRMDGFVAHVASFREIEVLDVRPLKNTGHDQIKFMQANLMVLDDSMAGVCDSLSCLHALEHFGLGRYGDPVDPKGHIKGFNNFHKMLQPGGTLYVSFPIGQSEVHFNAHRVFDPREILSWSENLFELLRFDYVDDKGYLHCDASLASPPTVTYGCGIYTLRKIN